MAVVYNTTLKNTRMDAVDTAANAGSGDAKLEIGTDSGSAYGSTLVSIDLNDPAFGAASGGVITLDNTPEPSGTAGATGTAAFARIRDSDDNDIVTGLTVGTGSEDIVLDSVSISSGQTVTITSGTITHG